ncbi:hypothetical protein DAPPUDRAFT_112201 [Daphnia pulex]|uniref:Peroxiredoxin-5 n=1 Tax=Daphnia pulex TaxID=6669 RepID=E9HBA1_DAPPU|nr:hypothetical protein DAPPUDRAFT_112201 [Daphnia pulex]|eukprot:EFX70934.1 hypothetical protein DAPPUDRAFT_112201 [Daphnia pulex]
MALRSTLRSSILSKVPESLVGLNFTVFGRKELHLASTFNMPIKVIIVGVSGAFTPCCSKTHLPGYVSDFEKFKSKGIDEIVCVAVNDPYVMDAWGKDLNTNGKVRMLADTNGAFAKAANLEKDLSGTLGNVR